MLLLASSRYNCQADGGKYLMPNVVMWRQCARAWWSCTDNQKVIMWKLIGREKSFICADQQSSLGYAY
jgi:hypothetical protein